ncbi:MAG: sodium ion-translocating decarboxylase subunit beta, partial [Lachnospiraceae bacterium]|nr:sodium ion-translocating decarboxylase subunit beta [Lachnospiraceae bacterium]
MDYIVDTLTGLVNSMGFSSLDWRNYVMIVVALVFLYLAIKKEYEPLLLVPIAFGMLLVNIYPPIMQEGGLLHYFYLGDEYGLWPSIIFLGVGAMTDFGPLIANPKSFLLGAAAQFGIFAAYLGAIIMLPILRDFEGAKSILNGVDIDGAAAAISIIGGADGPTSIFLASKLAPGLMGTIAVAAYSYMSLVPIIQPPIMKALTTEEERKIKMEQ